MLAQRRGTHVVLALSKHWFTTSFLQLVEGAGKRCSECVVLVQRRGIHVVQRRRGLKLQALVYDILPPEGAGKRCSECVVVDGSASLYNGDAVRTGSRPTRPSSIAFRHLPPDSATEEALCLRAVVHGRGQRPPKDLGTNMTAEAT